MDSIKNVTVSTPSSIESTILKEETPKQETDGQLKQRHLDFNLCSTQVIVDASEVGSVLPINNVVPPLATENVSGGPAPQDSSCTALSKPSDNKITMDQNQFASILKMVVSQSKAEERKVQREKKEAEMSAKREAKKRKEEEKLRLSSEKARTRELQSKKFLHYFTKSGCGKGNTNKTLETGWVPSFPIQPGMTLAKAPPPLQDKKAFDSALETPDDMFVSHYITKCKGKQCTRLKENLCLPTNQDDDVIVVDEMTKGRKTIKYKFLQFRENYRPGYYGTWQKRSTIIRPKNPFKKDETLLDYTVDSDDEWEEEEPGESLSDCHSGDEGEEMDEEEDEDGFFVPHGYLSDDEGELDDSDPKGLPKEEKMKMKEKAWEIEFARKCQPLKSVVIGCCWASNGTSEAKRVTLHQYKAVLFTILPITISCDQQEAVLSDVRTTPKSNSKPSPQSAAFYKKPVPEEAIPDLIKLLQGSNVGLERAIKKLRVCWGRKVLMEKKNANGVRFDCLSESDFEQASGISKRQVEKKIHEIAKKVDRVWQVDKSILEKYSKTKSATLNLMTDNFCVSPSSPLQEKPSFKPMTPLKENLTLNEKINIDSLNLEEAGGDENLCCSPAKKRLKLTEKQSQFLVKNTSCVQSL